MFINEQIEMKFIVDIFKDLIILEDGLLFMKLFFTINIIETLLIIIILMPIKIILLFT